MTFYRSISERFGSVATKKCPDFAKTYLKLMSGFFRASEQLSTWTFLGGGEVWPMTTVYTYFKIFVWTNNHEGEGGSDIP